MKIKFREFDCLSERMTDYECRWCWRQRWRTWLPADCTSAKASFVTRCCLDTTWTDSTPWNSYCRSRCPAGTPEWLSQVESSTDRASLNVLCYSRTIGLRDATVPSLHSCRDSFLTLTDLTLQSSGCWCTCSSLVTAYSKRFDDTERSTFCFLLAQSSFTPSPPLNLSALARL